MIQKKIGTRKTLACTNQCVGFLFFVFMPHRLSCGTSGVKLESNEGRYRRVPLTPCSH